jgi:hypothetical protein
MSKIIIATPMYGGQCTGLFTKSLIGLLDLLRTNGHEVVFLDLYNESLITRARNTLTEAFLRTDGTHLLFIDADEGFEPSGILKMIEENVEVIGAAVPMKGLNWKRVQEAALAGQPNLENFTAIYNVNIKNKKDLESLKSNPEKIVEVHNIGTGLMLIKREVFEELKDITETYKSDQQSLLGIKYDDEIHNFWNISVDENKRLLSEDYNFCNMWKSKGHKVYLAPYVKVVHAGTYWFK